MNCDLYFLDANFWAASSYWSETLTESDQKPTIPPAPDSIKSYSNDPVMVIKVSEFWIMAIKHMEFLT